MFHEIDSPWVFHRNEIDLLEEDIDEIYRLYGHDDMPDEVLDTDLLTMEQRLIYEQIQTEEKSEAEFSRNMDPSWLMQSLISETESNPTDFQPNVPIPKELFQEIKRPPLYEKVFLWADSVFQTARQQYEEGGSFREYAFRVYINIKLIPIKLSIAMQEETQDDPFADAVAEKEYSLTIIYLDRILESMLVMSEFENGVFSRELQVGFQIKQILKEHLSRLRQRTRRNKQGYL